MSTTEPRALSNTAIAGLHPASFAIVMATGIVSIAAQLRGFHAIALALLWLNVVCYGVLWLIGIALWAVSTYVIFTILTVKAVKPSVEDGLNGGWLVAVVAAQAVATLGGLVAPQLGECQEAALFFSLIIWLGGGMLYIWIISLIFYRYTFLPLDPRQLAPPYWINMGAMAISTLAGTLLVSNAPQSPLLSTLLPFLLGLTLLFWATATWWIPLLVALRVWRHVLRRVPLAYDVVYW